jgi:hypothetical protein
MFQKGLVYLRGTAGFFHELCQLDRTCRDIEPFTGTQTYILFFENVTGTGLLGVTNTVPKLYGTLHNAFSSFHINHHKILKK